jgi:hypothetical protein
MSKPASFLPVRWGAAKGRVDANILAAMVLAVRDACPETLYNRLDVIAFEKLPSAYSAIIPDPYAGDQIKLTWTDAADMSVKAKDYLAYKGIGLNAETLDAILDAMCNVARPAYSADEQDALLNKYPVVYSAPYGTGVRPAHRFDEDLLAIDVFDTDAFSVFRICEPGKLGEAVYKQVCTDVLSAAYQCGVWHPPMVAFLA